MIRLLLLGISFLLIIVFIGRFLGPDDLRSCGQKPSEEPGCQAADVIVAVSGGDTAARTVEAITLYKNGWAPRLVFSGAAGDVNSPSNAEVMRGIATSSGVPEDVISIDENSRNTKQNAEQTAELLEDDNIGSIILVTSTYHQRRTSLEFKETFQNVTILNHPVGNDNQWSFWWWLTLEGWYLAIGEIARILLFHIGVAR